MRQVVRICATAAAAATAAMLSANGWAADGAQAVIPAHGVDVGMCAVVKAFMDEATMRKNARLFKEAGVGFVRTDFQWRGIEKERGKYDYGKHDVMTRVAREEGIELLGLISHTPQWAAPAQKHFDEWLAFVETTVKRYPSVRHWEMFNEPNLESFWGPQPDPAACAELVRLTYQKIKSVDPKLVAVFPGLAGGNNATGGYPAAFLEGIFKSGVKGAYDAMSLHPYRHPHAPEEAHNASDPRAPDKWPVLKTMAAVRELMAKDGDGDRQFWITEFGFPTHIGTQGPGTMGDEFVEPAKAAPKEKAPKKAAKPAQKTPPGVTETEQGDFLPRMVLLSFQGGADHFFWFTTMSAEKNPYDKEHWFGVLHPDYRPRPAFLALKALKRACPAGSVMARDRFSSAPAYCVSWKRPDGQNGWALWVAERGATRKQELTIDGAVSESFDGLGAAAPVEVSNGKATVTLSGRVLYLIGPQAVALQ